MLKKILTTLFLGGLLAFSSCSSFVESTRKSLLGEETPRKNPKEVKWVSKAQYDELLDRYKNLSDRYEKLKDESLSAGAPQPESETVDVFAENGLADQAREAAKPKTTSPPKTPSPKRMTPGDLEQELSYFKKAAALRANGKIDEALKMFQYLERSSTDQIRVRARANIGQIYMEKNQYDLALQVFENMIRNDAFSGKVLDALRGAVASSDKLQLEQKKMKYQSILKDFFEIEG